MRSFDRAELDEAIGRWMLAIDRVIGEYRSYALLTPNESRELARLKCARDDLAAVLNERQSVRSTPKPSKAGGIR